MVAWSFNAFWQSRLLICHCICRLRRWKRRYNGWLLLRTLAEHSLSLDKGHTLRRGPRVSVCSGENEVWGVVCGVHGRVRWGSGRVYVCWGSCLSWPTFPLIHLHCICIIFFLHYHHCFCVLYSWCWRLFLFWRTDYAVGWAVWYLRIIRSDLILQNDSNVNDRLFLESVTVIIQSVS